MFILSKIRKLKIIIFLRNLIPNNIVNILLHLPKAILANIIYQFPSHKLKIIGITGTNGKTTTATMLYHILHNAGYKVALISTVSAKIGDKDIDTGFHVTSPDHFPMQKLLKQIVDQQFEYVVLEVTSHGLVQYRFWGVQFFVGVMTNVTEDHLLYHKTMDNYVKAKAKLFNNVKLSVLNVDDNYFKYIENMITGKLITYGNQKGDWNLNNFKFKLDLIGEFNRLNALAASIVANYIGVKKLNIKKYLAQFKGVRGRMQIMFNQKFKVVVDFAHTPDALGKALLALKRDLAVKRIKQGRLISIFGCAGERDINRRKMGKVSAQLADITIITAEDPRTEGVNKISNEIANWAEKGGAKEVIKSKFNKSNIENQHIYIKIPDRQMAIDWAISIAQTGDIIGIFGKGHERSMCFNTTEFPWTDQDAVIKSLKKEHAK